MAIDVTITFPTDPTQRPTVDNPTTQVDTIPATQASLAWQVSPNEDGVEITGIIFYQTLDDKNNSRNAYTPPFLNTPGGHDDGDLTTWKIDFNSTRIGATTLWYDLQFKDDDFNDLDWDPKLTINPR